MTGVPDDVQAIFQKLSREGASILLLDVPKGTYFLLDGHAFVSGPTFQGVKCIPSGVHHMCYGATDRSGEPSILSSMFLSLEPASCVVYRWDAESETLVRVSSEEEGRYATGVKNFEFDKTLGPYPISAYESWSRLSSSITAETLSRLDPVSGSINAEHREANAKGGRSDHHTKIYFTDVSRTTYKNAVGKAPNLTTWNMDSSYLLSEILERKLSDSPWELLGELQYAYIVFVYGQNMQAFEQWKKLTLLLCTCDVAMVERSSFFTKFIEALEVHVGSIPADLFSSCDIRNNFLRAALESLYELVYSNAVLGSSMQRAADSLFEKIRSVFEWDFGAPEVFSNPLAGEDDEYSPVVVADIEGGIDGLHLADEH